MHIERNRVPYLGVMTWAQLSAVTGVPVGTQALVSNWNQPFLFNGTRWVPVSGRVSLPLSGGTNVTLTGTTTQTALVTTTIPAGLLGTTGRLSVDILAGGDGGGNKTVTAYFGNTGFTFFTTGTQTAFRMSQRAGFVQLNSTGVQRAYQSGIGLGAGGGAAGGIDTTVDQPLVVSGTLTNTADTVFTWGVRVEIAL